ncbi:Ferric reduction oxidase 2 [Phytophthora citrophthora]|uniref:Ferric reduction oxidase 2 n=1 Tax=Phytophthora citrophthora TaxID=4793 RepID=A0AAD9LPN3_9STRA|nr:Ferric reduction oxidase 2 [Phytophthora citrophthora]
MATADSPGPDVEFSTTKTPGDQLPNRRESVGKIRKCGPAPWADRLVPLGNISQVVILASMLMYAFGQLFHFSNGYTKHVSLTINGWYGVPAVKVKGTSMGHQEMVRPTYFFLFCFIPTAVALALFEFLRHFNIRRITSRYVLNGTRFLRRKPRIMGKVIDISYGELLFLLFTIGGNIYVFQNYYRARVVRMKQKNPSLDMTSYLEIIALTFGYVCIYNMAFLFLPATRNCIWMEFLNISYANGIRYHRWMGVFTILTAFLHCTGFYWAWIREGTWVEEALPCFRNCAVGDDGKDRWMNTFGTIALLCFLAMGFAAIGRIRRMMYNVFYYIHHLFIVATFFVVLHWNSNLAWLFPSILLYTVCRALSSSNGFTPVSIREFTTLSHDIIKVVVERSSTQAGDFKLGSFVYLNVPAISKLQWHPFTISSSPHYHPETFTILLKSLGDWTQELVKYSDECKQKNVLPTIYLDGFYGASLDPYDEYATVCLVGGGIGVTPMLAILEDLVSKLRHGVSLTQKVFFVFTFREISLLEEIHPLLMQIKELDPQQQFFSMHFSLTRVPTTEQLDQRVDHDRLSGKPHVSATSYDPTTTKVSPKPFGESLRSPISRVVLFTASFFLAILFWIIVKYGNKVQVDDNNLWPLQNFVEITVIVLTVLLVVYLTAFIAAKRNEECANPSEQMVTPGGVQLYTSDVHTFRDLLAEYGVEVGHRPNMDELMQKAHIEHQQFITTHPEAVTNDNSTIGVFVSGPEALKIATLNAVANIGSRKFDVHEEEFNL